MTVKIEGKIVDYSVVKEESNQESKTTPPQPQNALDAALTLSEQNNVVQMHEKLERPELLLGSTYKIKTPLSEHALYVTINDVVLNPNTPFEKRRPFEIFINSKNMQHFQWIVALTRIISAVFRKGGDVTFLVEELHSVFDPQGGYFKRGGHYIPSLVAEIGDAIEAHMRMIGMMKDGLDEHQKNLISSKRREFEARQDAFSKTTEATFPEGSVLCVKCNTVAVMMMDGCMTCLSCGDSKCG
ncbi:MAG TPA: NrdJb [Gammaproteobacteria bacterium]|nr:NrdJb [Gammaproteobacteria bacterium]